jgi:hypothetical protein
MSLAGHATQIAFASSFNVDKLVRVFTGSYNGATQTVQRGGAFGPYCFSFSHGLNRPLACELLFSTDGGTTWQDGGSSKIAFSTSTTIYIFHDYAATAGTVLYKVYGSWIDDYDATNPSITPISYTDVKTQFDSRLNYQKIARQGVANFTSTGTTNIIHSLGYTPNAKAFYEAFSGEVWPANAGGSANLFLYDFANQDELEVNMTTSLMNLVYTKVSAGTRKVWYKVFYDAN